jgi:hypothetical protein
LGKVPPGTGRFRVFVLDGRVLLVIAEPVLDEPGKPVVLD